MSRGKLHSSFFQIDPEFALNNIEKFIVGIMLVPVIFTLDDAEANDRVVHLAQGLVVPP
jgi:hypothetical protein